MRRPLGVLFDYGDTVLHTESFDLLAGGSKLLEFATRKPDLTVEEIQRVADRIYLDLIQPLRDSSMMEFLVPQFHRLLYETLGISFSISFPEMEREFWRAAVKHTVCQGIGEVLDTLDAYGIRAGIVSNSSFSGAVMEEGLAEFDLARRFSFLISSADYGFRKSHPRIFEIAAKKMGLDPGDIWFAGDKPEYDVRGALGAGLCAVWYNTRGAPNDGKYECIEVRDWHAFCAHIEAAYRE